MVEEFDNVEIVDSENWSGKANELGIRLISLEQFRRCCIEGSKAMNINQGKTGQANYEADMQRDVFINSVKMLELVLLPDLLTQNSIKLELNENEKEIIRLEVQFDGVVGGLKRAVSSGEATFGGNYSLAYQEFSLKCIGLYQDRLGILSKLLNLMNYYGEQSSGGGNI